MMKKYIPQLALLLCLPMWLDAQEVTQSPIYTGAPSMHISPDARASALGEQGVATQADVYAQYWNPAKYPFTKSRSGLGLSYTPWLKHITDDIALMQVVGYTHLDEEGQQALGASLRYFTLGKVSSWDALGKSLGEVSPHEFALDISYSIKLNEYFALGAGMRYINSNQHNNPDNKASSALVADLAFYAQRPIVLAGAQSLWTAGLSLKNVGAKLKIEGGEEQYLPTNLALATGLTYPLNKTNNLSVNLELNKLLVPTPPRRQSSADDSSDAQKSDEAYDRAYKAYQNTSALAGVFRSFADAPGGFAEELKEIRLALGAEYTYDNRFFGRIGYSYLHPHKGSLQVLTFGAGIKLSAFSIDASYTMGMTQHNPLDQTLRFSLGFDMQGLTRLFR